MARARYAIGGKVVLITGGARGIGAEAARQLVQHGARVSLVGLEPEELERRAEELGANAAWFEADVRDMDALDAAVGGTVECFGGIDVVVANAGIAASGSVAGIDPAAFDRTIDVNLLGVWRTVRAALPHVTERSGYVLPIASAAAAMHGPLMASYCASKAGVEAFADSLRVEVAPSGTKVGCAYFSFIDTDMVSQAFERESTALLRERMKGPFTSRAPVGDAGAAIVRGIERRARHVVAPGWVLPLIYARTLLQPLSERLAIRNGIAEAVRISDTEPTEISTPQPEREEVAQ